MYDCAKWHEGQCPPQTQVHLYATGARVVGMTTRPEIVATKMFVNDSSLSATLNGGVSTTVTNTVTNTWSQSNSITAGAEIGFNAGVVSGKVSFSFTRAWNWGGSENQATAVGSTDNVSVTLGPRQQVKAQLQVSRGTLAVEVSYAARGGAGEVGRHNAVGGLRLLHDGHGAAGRPCHWRGAPCRTAAQSVAWLKAR